VRQCRGEYLAPRRAGVDDHAVVLDGVDGPQPGHVGHDAVGDLGSSEHRVPAALGREPPAVPGGPAHGRGDVLGGSGQQHGMRCPVHDVPEVVGRGRSGGLVEADLAVERR
jgi:hypothetical protein